MPYSSVWRMGTEGVFLAYNPNRQDTMNTVNAAVPQKSHFTVRPRFLAGCAAVLAVLFLPDLVAESYAAKVLVLLLATAFILAGCLLLLGEHEQTYSWRSLISLIAAVYLVISLPVFLFEISQIRWLMRHPWHHWFSLYVRPWVHWGYLFICLSIIGSLLGRGRARIAFVTGSLLLLVLRGATGTWVY